MKRHILLTAVLSVLVAAIVGCGGGGSSAPAATVTVSGVAAKGPISGGTVKVFAITNGAKGAQLGSTGTTSTDGNGTYSINIGSYTGPVLIEVSGGTYKDEATLSMVPLTTTLRAALSNVTANVSAAVTPLTELAVQKAGSSLTAASIDSANSLVSNLFHVDIINTIPVDATVTPSAGVTSAQKDYSLALAAISGMITPTKSLNTLLTTDFAIQPDNSLLPGTITSFNAAKTTFVNSTNNKISNPVTATSLQASKTNALADGASKVTLTASITAPVVGVNNVTFTITSGTATLSAATATLGVSTATIDLTSATIGSVTVTASYNGTTSTPVTINFPQPATADVSIALTRSISQLTNLNFFVINTPASSVTFVSNTIVDTAFGTPNITTPSVDSITTSVNLGRNTVTDSKDPTYYGFTVSANKPLFLMRYNVNTGIPTFAVSLISTEPARPATVFNSADPASSIPLSPALTVSDFAVTVTYKDAQGNAL